MTPYEMYQFWKQTGDPRYQPDWEDEQSDLIGEIIRREKKYKNDLDILVGQYFAEPDEVGASFRNFVTQVIKDLEDEADRIRQEFYHGAA